MVCYFFICSESKKQEVGTGILSPWFRETLCSDIKAFCKKAKPEIKKEFPNCKYKSIYFKDVENFILQIIRMDFGKIEEITKPQQKEAYSEGYDFSKYSLLYPNDPGDPFERLSKYKQAVPFPYNKEKREYFILRRFVSIKSKDIEQKTKIGRNDIAYYLFATERQGEYEHTNTIKDFRFKFCFCSFKSTPLDKEIPKVVVASFSLSFESYFELGEAAVPKSVQEPVPSKEEKAPSKEETPHTPSSKETPHTPPSKETNAIPKSSTIDSFKVEDTHPSKIKTSTIVVISSFCVLVVLIIWLLIHKFAK